MNLFLNDLLFPPLSTLTPFALGGLPLFCLGLGRGLPAGITLALSSSSSLGFGIIWRSSFGLFRKKLTH